jgi:predicted 3-demethylubiquinone-9 3-methyltransferase (glyoxalase superfamily)
VTPYAAGERAGQTMTVDFVLNGSKFVALNAGPEFRFNESISFQVPCEDQAEVDRYWTALTDGGGEESMCGWLKDKYGVSWQIVPTRIEELMSSSDTAQAARVTEALFQMKKIVIADLEAAAAAEAPSEGARMTV